MELKELINGIICKGGATLDRDLQPIDSKTGYMVSYFETEKTFDLSDIDYKEISNLILKRQADLKENEYLGFWVYQGKLYIDISINILDLKQAKQVGINNNQLSIYDLSNDTSIQIMEEITEYIVYKNDRYIKAFDTLKEVAAWLGVTVSSASKILHKVYSGDYEIEKVEYRLEIE